MTGIQAIAHVFLEPATPYTAVDLLSALSFKINGRLRLAVHAPVGELTYWAQKIREVSDVQSVVNDVSEGTIIRTLRAYGGIHVPRRFACASIFWKELMDKEHFVSHFVNYQSDVTVLRACAKGYGGDFNERVTFSAYQDYTDPNSVLLMWRGTIADTPVPIIAWDDHLGALYDLVSLERVYEYQCTYTLPFQNLLERPVIDLTPIIPVQFDFPDRIENLLSTVDYILKVYRCPEVVISEYSEQPKLAGIFCGMPGVRYCFTQPVVPNTWSRSVPTNNGARLVKTSALAVWDADIVLPYSSVLGGFKSLETSQACIPWNDFINCHKETGLLVKNKIVSPKEMVEKHSARCAFNADVINTAAGCCFVRTDRFRHLRGMSELFHGFGWEDCEFAARLLRTGAVAVAQGPLYHIAHRRGATGKPDPNTRSFNIQEYAHASARDREQTLKYLGVTEETGEYFLPHKQPEKEVPVDEKDYSVKVNRDEFIQQMIIPHRH